MRQCFVRRRDSVDPRSDLIFLPALRCCAQESKGCTEHFTCERSKEDEWPLVVGFLFETCATLQQLFCCVQPHSLRDPAPPAVTGPKPSGATAASISTTAAGRRRLRGSRLPGDVCDVFVESLCLRKDGAGRGEGLRLQSGLRGLGASLDSCEAAAWCNRKGFQRGLGWHPLSHRGNGAATATDVVVPSLSLLTAKLACPTGMPAGLTLVCASTHAYRMLL